MFSSILIIFSSTFSGFPWFLHGFRAVLGHAGPEVAAEELGIAGAAGELEEAAARSAAPGIGRGATSSLLVDERP